MKRSLVFSALVTALLLEACGTTSPQNADEILIASDHAVLSGRHPVLFVGRAKEDGQWIFLTDERSLGGPVAFASFADVVALDGTLNQVRDLPVGWKATRETVGGPWRRDPILGGSLAAGNVSKSKPPREPASRPSSHYSIMIGEPRKASGPSRHVQVSDNVLSLWQGEESSEGFMQTLLWSDSLKSAARDSLDTLAVHCGLDTLKENYAPSEVPPARSLLFVIGQSQLGHSVVTRLNDCWIPSLYRLTVFVNTLLPRRYAMGLDMSPREPQVGGPSGRPRD